MGNITDTWGLLTYHRVSVVSQTLYCGCFPNTKTFTFMVWVGLWCLASLSTNISVISWQSVVLVEETGVPGENHRPASSY